MDALTVAGEVGRHNATTLLGQRHSVPFVDRRTVLIAGESVAVATWLCGSNHIAAAGIRRNRAWAFNGRHA